MELIAKLNEGLGDDYRKTIGQLIAGDPTGMMEKKYGPILQGIVQGRAPAFRRRSKPRPILRSSILRRTIRR